MGSEPGELELGDFPSVPTEGSSEALHAGQVIGPVYTSLTFIPPSKLAPDEGRDVVFSPDSVAVKVMNIKSCSEGVFEGLVICFPCYYLGVGSTEVSVKEDMTRVRENHLPDGGEVDVGGFDFFFHDGPLQGVARNHGCHPSALHDSGCR